MDWEQRSEKERRETFTSTTRAWWFHTGEGLHLQCAGLQVLVGYSNQDPVDSSLQPTCCINYSLTKPPFWIKRIFPITCLLSYLFLFQASMVMTSWILFTCPVRPHFTAAQLWLASFVKPTVPNLFNLRSAEGICHKTKHTLNVTLNVVSSNTEIQNLDG